MRPPVAAALVLSIVAQGCQYNPHAHLYTTRKPECGDVVGRYRLTELHASRRDGVWGLAALDGRSCVVELRADGTFAATNVPPSELGLSGSEALDRLIDDSGAWSIGEVTSVDGGGGRAQAVWGLRLRSSPDAQPRMLPPRFTGQKPPHGLIFTLGDPDAGEAMILTREG